MHDFQDKKKPADMVRLNNLLSRLNRFFFNSDFVYVVKTRMKFSFPIYRAKQTNANSH
jgi:hypothetical protein